MSSRTKVGKGEWCFLGCAAVGFLFLTMMACSSERTKPLAQPTPEQVRSHADRGFDKLKQEEQERASQPSAPQP